MILRTCRAGSVLLEEDDRFRRYSALRSLLLGVGLGLGATCRIAPIEFPVREKLAHVAVEPRPVIHAQRRGTVAHVETKEGRACGAYTGHKNVLLRRPTWQVG